MYRTSYQEFDVVTWLSFYKHSNPLQKNMTFWVYLHYCPWKTGPFSFSHKKWFIGILKYVNIIKRYKLNPYSLFIILLPNTANQTRHTYFVNYAVPLTKVHWILIHVATIFVIARSLFYIYLLYFLPGSRNKRYTIKPKKDYLIILQKMSSCLIKEDWSIFPITT